MQFVFGMAFFFQKRDLMKSASEEDDILLIRIYVAGEPIDFFRANLGLIFLCVKYV